MLKSIIIAALMASSSVAFAATYADVDASGTVTNLVIWDGSSPYGVASGHSLIPYASPAGINSTWNGSTFSAPPAPPAPVADPNAAATQSQLSAAVASEAAARAAAINSAVTSTQPVTTVSAVPASGPGAGRCQEYYLPASLLTPVGDAGTCARIEMCGTSTAYKVVSTNVGSC